MQEPGRRRYQVNLGMCRLSIIDREHGKQPFGKSCKVFFNGEIYNHETIRRTMRHFDEHPVWFETKCDTEVISQLYEREGDDFIHRLDGMFAIAIWDERENVLKLYRDRIGKKPLYYYHDEAKGIFLFASEIKAILKHPAYEKKMNKRGLYQYLCLQYVPEPETAFDGITVVPPGTSLHYHPQENTLSFGRYWDLAASGIECDDDVIAVQNVVRNAVHKRLESEVPLGVYLSGGIDSAIVTALASEKLKDLHTFTMGFLEPQYDETQDAQLIADMYKTNHHVERVTSVNLRAMANEIVAQYDQPFGDCSAIPTMLLARLSKKYITVALNGDGGDEAFGGYPRYWMCQGQLPNYHKYMTVWPHEVALNIWPIFEPRPSWMYINGHINGEDASALMYCDMKTYMPNDTIVKMERATMAASVEARSPFLDPSVLQLGLRLPVEQKLSAYSGKLILKEAFKDMLPDKFIHLPKRGFGVPMNEWLRSAEGLMLLGQTILAGDAFGALPEIDNNYVAHLVGSHLQGRSDVGHGLWILIMLDMWLRRHF
jgi:asparagine synthase (glutamine-hydrolysing)